MVKGCAVCARPIGLYAPAGSVAKYEVRRLHQWSVGGDVVDVGDKANARRLWAAGQRRDVHRDGGLSGGVEGAGQKPDYHLTVIREGRVGIADTVQDLDHLVAGWWLDVGACLRRWTGPVVRLGWAETVVKAGSHHPGGDGVGGRGRRQQGCSLHSARSATTWPITGPTRSRHAQRHRASKSPAAATAPRKAGGCERACAAVQRAVLPMIAGGAPPSSSSAAYTAPRNASSSPIETATAATASPAGSTGTAADRTAAGSRSTAPSARPPRILRPSRDVPRPRRSAGQPTATSMRAAPPRTRAATAICGSYWMRARDHSISRTYAPTRIALRAG